MWWYTSIGTFVFRASGGLGFAGSTDGWFKSMAGVVNGSASTATGVTGCLANARWRPPNEKSITRKLAMGNRPIVEMLPPSITSFPWPIDCWIAEAGRLKLLDLTFHRAVCVSFGSLDPLV
jgi:hypothetical protein